MRIGEHETAYIKPCCGKGNLLDFFLGKFVPKELDRFRRSQLVCLLFAVLLDFPANIFS